MTLSPDRPFLISAPFGSYFRSARAYSVLGSFTRLPRPGRTTQILRTVRPLGREPDGEAGDGDVTALPELVGFGETTDFVFHRQPRPDQLRGFELAKDEEYWAHFWDPRCGKTKVINDEFRYNYELGRVTALVVIAFPSKVHLIWASEIEKDFPPDLLEKTKIVVWRSGRMDTRANRDALDAIVRHRDGPAILTMNCEAIRSAKAWNYLKRFFSNHKVMLVADEDWATSWTAQTRRLIAMGKGRTTVMRRWLTGTPADEGPTDVFFPCQFLKPGSLGFDHASTFRDRYTAYEEEEIEPGIFVRKKGFNRKTQTQFDIFKGYVNLPELKEKLSAFSDRVIRHGSERVYATRLFEMTDKQRAVYDMLRDKYRVELSDGSRVEAREALLRMARLQTVARNYYPPERYGVACANCAETGFLPDGTDCGVCLGLGTIIETTDLRRIDDRNPAADALAEEIAMGSRIRPFVVWARYNQEVTDAIEAAKRITPNVARYDGFASGAEREDAYRAFVAGEIDGIVATERSSLSRGHDLKRAKLIVYYGNEYSLRHRRQSEARGDDDDSPEAWTDVVDLVAIDTRDVEVIEALRAKRSIADQVTGDPPSRWI